MKIIGETGEPFIVEVEDSDYVGDTDELSLPKDVQIIYSWEYNLVEWDIIVWIMRTINQHQSEVEFMLLDDPLGESLHLAKRVEGVKV